MRSEGVLQPLRWTRKAASVQSWHPWGEELSDVPENELRGSWQEKRPIASRYIASLLQYPLLEIDIDPPAPLLRKADSSFADKIALVHYILEAADSCLTVFRLAYCSFKRLPYLPGRAGRLTGGSCALYLVPSHPAFGADRHTTVAEDLTVSNNWLGLEVDSFKPNEEDLQDEVNVTESEERFRTTLKRFDVLCLLNMWIPPASSLPEIQLAAD